MTEPNKCSNPECDFGWVTYRYSEVKNVKLRSGELREVKSEHEGARPCPTCDPVRAEIFTTAQTPEELQTALQNRSTHKRLDAYKKSEDSKTKVL